MKTAYINPRLWGIVNTADADVLRCGYFGGSNLMAAYLNDYSADACNSFVGDWLDDNLNKPGCPDISAVELIETPDYLIQFCASEFYSALMHIVGDRYAEHYLRHANTHFEPWGNFYIFANGDTAAAYIIRADTYHSALEWLIEKFESAFAIEEEDADDETMRNDSGTPVNIDYLQLIGAIKDGN